MSGSTTSISVASSDVDAAHGIIDLGIWARRGWGPCSLKASCQGWSILI